MSVCICLATMREDCPTHGNRCTLPAHADLERRLDHSMAATHIVETKRKMLADALAASEKRAREVAGEMRAQATKGNGPFGTLPQFAGPGQLEVWASRLSPEPPAEKMRWWIQLPQTSNSGGFGGVYQQSCPGPGWVELVPAKEERV